MAAIELADADEGNERVHVEPAATDAELHSIAARLGGAIPSELRALLAVTKDLSGRPASEAHAELSLCPPGGLFDGGHVGAGPLFLVMDYGNGDGLYLEPGEPSCRLWWFGHDSWPATLVARSLLEYVERCAVFLEAVASPSADDESEDERHSAPYEARWLREPQTPGEVDAANDASVQNFLDSLPADAWVFDFRGDPCPIGAELPEAVPVRVRRHGELVALLR